jgi:acyl-CoA thioester hydrolase
MAVMPCLFPTFSISIELLNICSVDTDLLTNSKTQRIAFNFPIRVYYEDTDAGGIVYYANYLKFCERARTEWLRTLTISQQALLKENVGFVVKRIEMDNAFPAKLDDLLQVKTTITELKRASITFKQVIKNQNEQVIANVIAQVVCVTIDTLKPCAFPITISGAFKRVS